MPTPRKPKPSTRATRPAHCRRVALVLQGGGALGAYQAGAYCTLAEAGYEPDWVAGVSIGAINAAIIAGNPPERRAARLRGFWETISSGVGFEPLWRGDFNRPGFNALSALSSVLVGVAGFFQPRFPPSWLSPPGSLEAIGLYDTEPLRHTLADCIDFDLVNEGGTRLSVGAANVSSGNSIYFDSRNQAVHLDHVLASGALPPGFSPVEIDGELYWDGGVVANSPLQYVLDDHPMRDRLVFQIDLFSARGRPPRDLAEVLDRQKEILYSSRTRLNTDAFKRVQDLRRAAGRLLESLPEDLRAHPEAKLLDRLASDATMSVVHLIYRRRAYETQSKDYEFSRSSMEAHWRAGVEDARLTLRDPRWLERPPESLGVVTFDLARETAD